MADEPRPMSQEEIDNLFANLGDPSPGPEDAAPDAGDNESHPAGVRPTEIDGLLDELSQEQDKTVDPAISDAAAPPDGPLGQDAIDALLAESNEAPAANSDGPLGQDAIDALLAESNDEPAANSDGPLGQDAIDALLAESNNAPAADSDGPLGQDGIDDLLNQLDSPPPEAAPNPLAERKPVTGPMGQDDIDALLNQLDDEQDAPAAEAAPAAASSDGPMDQDAIDALLGNLDSPAAVEEPKQADAVSGPMDQDAIDALLGNLSDEQGSAASQPEVPSDDTSGPMDQDAIDALLGNLGDDQAAAETSDGPLDQDAIDALVAAQNTDSADDNPLAGALSSGDSALTQSDIDALLSGLDGDDQAVGTESIEGEGPATATITPTKIERLMAKHDEGGIGEDSATGTGVIEQDDVDALLAQMEGDAADTMVAEQPDDDAIEDKLKQREDDIDALLEEAGQQVQATAVDAIGPMAPMMSGAGAAPGASMVPAGSILSPEELRGSKYLLIAAVFLLAMCSVTLFLVVASVNSLTDELRSGRTAQEKPKDDFQEALAVAQAYLADENPDQVVRGVKYIQRMKETFPEREEDVTLLLARHYRDKGSHGKAWREFQRVSARSQELINDPYFYLDFAGSLHASKRIGEAESVLYELIANESFYLSSAVNDKGEQTRDEEELKRNEVAIRKAYVLLGRLYTERLETGIEDAQGDAS